MDMSELMKLPIEGRTDVLERFAARQGLKTAPGVRIETDLLMSALWKFDDQARGDAEAMPRSLWAHYLKAPLLLVRLLELFQPHLLKLDRPLRVLYVGAGHEEVLDGGRWHGLLWAFKRLSRHLPEITAVGPALGKPHEASDWAEVVEAVPQLADLLPGTLEQTLSVPEGCINWEEHFDVVVMHHPGFVGHVFDWMHDQAWADLAGYADIPIIGTSFDAVDFEFDKRGLATSGRIVDQVFWNPAAHVNPAFEDPAHNRLRTRVQWGGVLWSTQRDPGVSETSESLNQRVAREWFDNYHFHIVGDRFPISPLLRWHFSCPMQFDDVHQHLLVSDDIRVNCSTGEVDAFGQRFAPGPKTLEALAAQDLNARLKLTPEVIVEISDRLDPAAAASEWLRRKAEDDPLGDEDR